MKRLLQMLGHLWWLLLIAIAGSLILLLPFEGTVLVSSLSLDPDDEFPQYTFSPTAPGPRDNVLITITDNVPWTHVKLTANGSAATFTSTQALPLRQQWSWTWQISLADVAVHGPSGAGPTELSFYRDCASGCKLRDRRQLDPYISASELLPRTSGTPTKLCVAFPDPERDWHGRSGWVVDLTYANTDADYWQIDALGERVQQSMAKGLRVLVRVDFAPEQSLPPEGDNEAVSAYLDHIHRLARDDRLQSVYGYIIGSGFNALDSNRMATEMPTTPQWYATLFNGIEGADSNRSGERNSAVQAVRANSVTARVLVGPVRPWNRDQSGTLPFEINVPWLNYMNEVVSLIDQNHQAASANGIPLNGPDGFALNVPGRPYAVDQNEFDPADEPTIKFRLPTLGGNVDDVQGGFQIYREWLAIINRFPSTRGKPAYITSTNTFGYDSDNDDAKPAQSYPTGWLTNALSAINQEPQIESLCWFLDLIPEDQRWFDFSLSVGHRRMSAAAKEFDQLLLE